MKLQDLDKKSFAIEQELTAIIFGRSDLALRSSQLVTAADFHSFGKHFSTIIAASIHDKNLAAEFIANKLLIHEFINHVSLRDVETVCADLRDISNARKIYRILENGLLTLPMSDTDKFASDLQLNLIQSVSKKETEQSSVKSALTEYHSLQDVFRTKFENGEGLIGLPTGYNRLDAIIDGVRPEHFWVIGGYTNMGKSFAALNIAANFIKEGKRVVYYSLEMSRVDIISRLIGILSEQNGLSVLKGFAKDEEGAEKAMKTLEDSNLSIHSNKAELSDISLSMYEETLNKKVDLFVVDFIQIMTVKGSRSEYETVTACALELQQLVKRLKVPIIALSQISNEGARNSDQDVMTFKGSGAIAAAADLAIEIMKAEENKEEWVRKIRNNEPVLMKWMVRKNRHGKVGKIEMTFNGQTGVFKLSDYEKI